MTKVDYRRKSLYGVMVPEVYESAAIMVGGLAADLCGSGIRRLRAHVRDQKQEAQSKLRIVSE